MPPLIFPQESTADVLQERVNLALTLRLYSNNHTPQVGDTFASYIEVLGGGYAAVALNSAQWEISPGSPSVALYNSFVPFTFTGVPAIATVYGYYITTATDLVLLAEEFDPSDIPFVVTGPGRTVQIRPRFGADNLIYVPPEVL